MNIKFENVELYKVYNVHSTFKKNNFSCVMTDEYDRISLIRI